MLRITAAFILPAAFFPPDDSPYLRLCIKKARALVRALFRIWLAGQFITFTA